MTEQDILRLRDLAEAGQVLSQNHKNISFTHDLFVYLH